VPALRRRVLHRNSTDFRCLSEPAIAFKNATYWRAGLCLNCKRTGFGTFKPMIDRRPILFDERCLREIRGCEIRKGRSCLKLLLGVEPVL